MKLISIAVACLLLLGLTVTGQVIPTFEPGGQPGEIARNVQSQRQIGPGCSTLRSPLPATPANAQSQVGPSGVILPTFIPAGPSGYAAQPTASDALLLYGGKGHRVFLGCINCGESDTNSIYNQYGTYGSQYSDLSIWNSYGSYGSRYSDDSPWNSYASNPPAVVDDAGNFYGYFTANKFNPKRTRIPSLLRLLAAHAE